jgi:hypothetical protein
MASFSLSLSSSSLHRHHHPHRLNQGITVIILINSIIVGIVAILLIIIAVTISRTESGSSTFDPAASFSCAAVYALLGKPQNARGGSERPEGSYPTSCMKNRARTCSK